MSISACVSTFHLCSCDSFRRLVANQCFFFIFSLGVKKNFQMRRRLRRAYFGFATKTSWAKIIFRSFQKKHHQSSSTRSLRIHRLLYQFIEVTVRTTNRSKTFYWKMLIWKTKFNQRFKKQLNNRGKHVIKERKTSCG